MEIYTIDLKSSPICRKELNYKPEFLKLYRFSLKTPIVICPSLAPGDWVCNILTAKNVLSSWNFEPQSASLSSQFVETVPFVMNRCLSPWGPGVVSVANHKKAVNSWA